MTVADDRCDAGYSLPLDEAQNLAAFVAIAGPVVIGKLRVARARPAWPNLWRQILKVDAPIEHTDRVRPELPHRGRRTQPIEEPCLLRGAEHRLRCRVDAWVGNVRVAEANGRRRMAAVVRAARVESLDHVLCNDGGKSRRTEARRVRCVSERLRPIAAVVGEDEVDVAAPAQRTKDRETVDGGEIAALHAKALLVEIANRCIGDGRRVEALEARAAGLLHACRLILEPRLIRGHLARLRGTHTPEALLTLPAFPRELE